jgi:prepilin-type N-terminal cleavage/methylation domain-containing protein
MKRRAFTLVELLVSMAVLALLASLLFPAVQAARSAAREAECRHNLHEIGVDLHTRMGRREEIPDFTEGPHRFECPEHVARFGKGSYMQLCVFDRRPTLIEHHQAPSERIVAVFDLYGVHHERRLALFLDGHVAAISDGDVGYEDL